ncbi:MAG: DUF4493 domain-containing protein [Rikenellaceae bacterium]
MKKVLNFITIFLFAVALSVGCSDDTTSFEHPDGTINPGDIIDPDSQGYLSFDNFSVVVESEGEAFLDDKSDDVVATKSGSTSQDLSTFTVKISRDSDGEVVYKDSYTNAIAVTEPMVLSAGVYTVEVYSCESSDIPSADWYCPEYAGKKSYSVGDENVTAVGEITCSLANVMTSVTISADVVAFFDPSPEDDADKLQVLLECGDGELTFFPTDEDKLGYFAVPEDGTITIYLTGMYNQSTDSDNPNYIRFEKGDWTQKITDVAAGQYRDIEVKIDYNSTGSTLITVTVDSWVYDTEEGLDVTSQTFLLAKLTEEVMFDPDSEATNPSAPSVSVDNGVGIDESYIINSSMYDIYTETYSPTYTATITPEEGTTVESVSISISSTCEYFGDALATAGFVDGAITVYEGGEFVASSALGDYISMREDGSAVIAAIKYKGIAGLAKYVGVHTIKVEAIDAKGRASYTTLMIETEVDSKLPQVVWIGGYDFDTRYEIFASGEGDENNPTVELYITSISEAGFTALSVEIVGDVLSDSLLESVGLSKNMDLIYSDASVLETLADFDLPVGDEIKGQQSVTVNITKLISLLAGVGTGESDFTLRVSDEYGETTKTVMVVRN